MLNLSQFRLTFLAASVALVVSACSGGSDDNGSLCVGSEFNDNPACDESTSDGGTSSRPDDIVDEDTNLDTDPDVEPEAPSPEDEDVIEVILNPDNCSEAQLGLLSALQTQDPGELAKKEISGVIKFNAPKQKDTGELDFSDEVTVPALGSTVNALACDGSVVAKDGIGFRGGYFLRVPVNIDVTLQVVSSEYNPYYSDAYSDSGWDVKVVDNMNGDAVYLHAFVTPIFVQGSDLAIDEAPYILGSSVAVKNVDYTIPVLGADGVTRVSAPFAIANTAFEAMVRLTLPVGDNLQTTGFGLRGKGADYGNIVLSWNPSNTETIGDPEIGDIGSTHYNVDNKTIYVLGDALSNTDEFDKDVLYAQIISFVIDYKARFDDLKGDVDFNGVHDARVAFKEGFPIGFATAFNEPDLPFYRDSRVTNSISIDLDSTSVAASSNPADSDFFVPGYFTPLSVAKVVYDLLDDPSAGDDDNVAILSSELIQAVMQANESGAFVQLVSFINALNRTVFDDLDGDTSVSDDSILISAATLSGIDDILITENINFTINGFDDVIAGEEEEKLFSAQPFFNQYTWGGEAGTLNEETALLSGAYGLNAENILSLPVGSGVPALVEHAGIFGSFYVPQTTVGDKVTIQSAVDRFFESTFCVTNTYGTVNKPGNFRHIAFTVFDKQEAGDDRLDSKPDLEIKVRWLSGQADTNTSLRLIKNDLGELKTVFFADGVKEGQANRNIEIVEPFEPGSYIMEVSTPGNSGVEGEVAGEVCYSVTIDDYAFFEIN